MPHFISSVFVCVLSDLNAYTSIVEAHSLPYEITFIGKTLHCIFFMIITMAFDLAYTNVLSDIF